MSDDNNGREGSVSSSKWGRRAALGALVLGSATWTSRDYWTGELHANREGNTTTRTPAAVPTRPASYHETPASGSHDDAPQAKEVEEEVQTWEEKMKQSKDSNSPQVPDI